MKWLRRILIGLVAVVLVLGIFMIFLVRRSFPTVDGVLEVSGLQDQVDVVRDEAGIPHIYAANAHDLFFAQGYTHAQERFWQMDFWRHIGSARLSEMFGASQLDTDKFLRSLGLVESAEEELATMPLETRQILEAYADGVNAYLAEHDGAEVSLEYGILPLTNPAYEIEPWTPINSLTWAKMMSWDLSANMRTEIARAILSADLPVERIEQLYPPYPAEHPVIVPDDQKTTAEAGLHAALPPESLPALAQAGVAAEAVWALTGGGFEGVGSNNWSIGGSLTESGMPILANDPHLSIQMPSIWIPNGLHCTAECDFEVVGFSFAGVPGVVIGHNDQIAWGVTNQAVDTQDLFIEKVNPNNPDEYEVDGEWVPFEVRTEVIKVAGGEDVTFEARSTRHGPVISGTFLEVGELDDATTIDLPETYVVALSWQTLHQSSLAQAIIALNRSKNYDEFRVATSLWDIAPQNIVYADVEGNIAYQSTGEVPIRANGDGRYPVPGWASEYEWTGLVPFELMPRMFNPPRGYVATANQHIIQPGTVPFFTADAALGYRADRIETMIVGTSDHTVDSSQTMQFDTRDGGAANLVPFLLDVPDEGNEAVVAIQSLLSDWARGDEAYQARAGSAGTPAYMATWRHLLALTFHDDLPEDYWPVGGSRWFEVVKRLLDTPSDLYWDDVATSDREDRDAILHQSMIDAHDELTELLGANADKWRWGDLHAVRFENQTLGQSGIAPIEWLFNRTAPARAAGGASIVNAVGWDASASYEVDWVPSMRMVIDLDDFSKSVFVHTTGTSGHAFHPYYDNMIELWTDGEYTPMYWNRDQIDPNTSSTLTLVPAG